MEIGIEYLLRKGHRKIALATPWNPDETNPRGVAWQNMMLPQLGSRLLDYLLVVAPEDLHVEETQDNFLHYGHLLARKFLASRCDASAIICFNDALAAGLIHELHKQGIRVPDDVSVVGMDASSLGKSIYPSITSVSLNPFVHGQECARILIEIIEQRNVSRKTHIPISIFEGDSVRTLK